MVLRIRKAVSRWRLHHAPAWLWLMPNVTMALFIVAMGSLLWLLYRHEQELQRNNLARDIQWAERSIVKQLEQDRDFIDTMAREKAEGRLSRAAFEIRAGQYLKQNHAILDIVWNDANLDTQWAAPDTKSTLEIKRERAAFAELERMARLTYKTGRPTYTEIYSGYDRRHYIEYHSPILFDERFFGTISVVYSLEGIAEHLLPSGISRYV